MPRPRRSRGIGDFSTAKLLVLKGGKFNEVRDLGEVSMGQPDVLASFIERGRRPVPGQATTASPSSTTAAATPAGTSTPDRPAPRSSRSRRCGRG